MASPLTLASDSSVIGMGWVIALDQVRVSPATLPLLSASPMRPVVLPVKVSPLVVIEAFTSCAPIGVLMVIFQLPSADMCPSQKWSAHLSADAGRVQE